MKWHLEVNKRPMPWKGEKDPYKIWLSEVILQQTRVEQGWGYYTRFIKQYPTIKHLARAADQEVYKLWEGLGYYSRCKNLLFTARQIVKDYNGIFPDRYEAILALKGVGPYTAAAIASFAYNQPYAVVDGNVFRVLSRFFGVATPIDSIKGKKVFTALAGKVLSIQEPGAFNQAIMDFGATVCKPLSPGCSQCPLKSKCAAFNNGSVNQLPVKEKVLLRKNRWFYYFLFEHKGKLLVQQRGSKDIWENLFEFYLLEAEAQLKWDDSSVLNWLKEQLDISKASVTWISKPVAQQLTHRQIKGQFIGVKLSQIPASLKKSRWQLVENIHELPFPRLITQFLAEGLGK